MTLYEEIIINKFGQNLIESGKVVSDFNLFDLEKKRSFLTDLEFLIIQSKPSMEYVEDAIYNSGLKSSYTPCVLLQKGKLPQVLAKIIALPEMELGKAFVLLLNLFRISYQKRFSVEKNHPNKWWYWDLSEDNNILEIKRKMGHYS